MITVKSGFAKPPTVRGGKAAYGPGLQSRLQSGDDFRRLAEPHTVELRRLAKPPAVEAVASFTLASMLATTLFLLFRSLNRNELMVVLNRSNRAYVR